MNFVANSEEGVTPTQLQHDCELERKHNKLELGKIAERFLHEFPKQTPFDKNQKTVSQ
ncbi:hypothetical protein [Acinetobacter pittii]|uniref:hypothetical protein n=1 Tax=Acinetobacter pittii TaxID=48296 RepID=UPI00148AE130|nr:hypothetical protein [Acinetobacter pittii]MCK0919793.1 hypothetical protein [Acinetobacter pittii]